MQLLLIKALCCFFLIYSYYAIITFNKKNLISSNIQLRESYTNGRTRQWWAGKLAFFWNILEYMPRHCLTYKIPILEIILKFYAVRSFDTKTVQTSRRGKPGEVLAISDYFKRRQYMQINWCHLGSIESIWLQDIRPELDSRGWQGKNLSPKIQRGYQEKLLVNGRQSVEQEPWHFLPR